MEESHQEKYSFSRNEELLKFGSVYVFMALINLRVKLSMTGAWFDGTLLDNHQHLLAFQYMNNEQSRLLQFYIPETFHRLLGLSIIHAYILQRWLFVLLAFICFHFYLRKWFDSKLAFAGVLSLAAIMPLSYFNDLQESSPLLLLTFLLALWAIREHRTVWYMVILTIGAVNNETMLILPAVFFFYNFKSFEPKHLLRLSLTTLGTSLPAYAVEGLIRYINRDRPHLGGAWHWPDNIKGMWGQLGTFPLDYWAASYFYFLFIFGAFWLYAFLRYSKKPLFLQRAALMIPLFIFAHLLTGIFHEVRQMLPLSFIIIPMALFYLFPEARPHSDERPANSAMA
jgi:hypothetical protein